MRQKAAPMKYPLSFVIKMSFRYFAYGHIAKRVLIFLIFALTFAKNAFSNEVLYEIDKLSVDGTFFYNVLLNILFYKGTSIFLNFMTDFLFERSLAPYGSAISTLILHNLLFTNKASSNNISGSLLEFHVTEGAKALAKISRFLVLGLFSKAIHLYLDLLYIFRKDFTEGKILFLTVLLGTLIISIFRIHLNKKAVLPLSAVNDMSYFREKQYAEAMEMMHIVKSYRAEDRMVRKYRVKSKFWERSWIWYRYLSFGSTFFYDVLCAIFQVFVAILYVKMNPDCTFAKMMIVIKVTSQIVTTFTNLIRIHADIYESAAVADRVLDQLMETPESRVNTLRVDTFNDALEIKNVTYAARGKVIFNDVSMTLRKGDKAALYGPNGTGKSSLFKIIMNLDEYGGSVELDGTDIRNFLMTDYRSIITYVPQDTRLFDETIYANLAFGNNKSYEEIVEESKRMGIHGRVMMLPNGYNTVVGEGGRNLNGGLRQKIFYTRAMLRDTAIYLFDEPTNNLDEENARFLMDYLGDEKYRNKTMLVICHDKSIVEKFPKIYRFSNGKIEIEKE